MLTYLSSSIWASLAQTLVNTVNVVWRIRGTRYLIIQNSLQSYICKV